MNLTKGFVLLHRSNGFIKGQLNWNREKSFGSSSSASIYQDLERLEKNTLRSHVVIALLGVLGSYQELMQHTRSYRRRILETDRGKVWLLGQ